MRGRGVRGAPAALLVILAVALVAGIARPAGVGAQTPGDLSALITVTDVLGGTPIEGAVLTLTPTDTAGVPVAEGRVYGTDVDGRARTQPLPPGDYLLDVRAPGYQTLLERIRLEGPPPVSLAVQLLPQVLEVEGVTATARRNPFLEAGGFYERQTQGLGVSFTGQELAALGLFQATDLFRTLAGVTLDYGSSPTSPLLRFRQGCRPDVVMDGANLGQNVRIDDLVSPAAIEGIEIYRGATVPNTLSSNSCGAVIIWTLSRNPEGARPFSWGRLVFGIVVILVAQVIGP